ncbi:MAG: hypothetical protein C5B59_10965 [Bacteroidetes bacterium]|nr:MAG: hypothetical protein C5B59_10965 [Bacteroidota bacterium]
MLKQKIMKTLFTFIMLVLIATTGVLSCRLFMHFHYGLSALLTLASILSIMFCINILSNSKIRLS